MAQARALDISEVERVFALSDRKGVRLTEWFPRGIPAVEGLAGSIAVSRDLVADTVSELMRAEELRLNITIFPNGIPAVDEYVVRFQTP
jgi:hypothetical protein